MFLLISWRWVRNVVAVIATTRIAASRRTLGRSVEVKLSEILAPKIVALAKLVARSEVSRARGSSGFLAAWSIRLNSARKIGICSRIGRQEANGLVPVSL